MRKRLYAMWSVLLVLIISIAVLGQGCVCSGEIEVNATICGVTWSGPVSYTLNTTSTGCAPTPPIAGTHVPDAFGPTCDDCGNWTCTYVSGGPPGAYLVDITPSPTQELPKGGFITFTLNFELPQDAAIIFDTWTLKGMPWQYEEMEVVPCDWVDVHFKQWVMGCPLYEVAVNETSVLTITQTQGPSATVFVINDWCAVNKTPEPFDDPTHGLPDPPPPVKLDQVPSINGDPVNVGENITLTLQQPEDLDVETSWELLKCLNYTKSINWFGISKAPFVLGDEHDCVLFELVLPVAGQYTFTLDASAELELVDDVDVNPQNDKAVSTTLTLTVNVP